MLDMPRAREVFEASEDSTVGIEEEFQILDPRPVPWTSASGSCQAAQADEVLRESVAGELIESEIEIRSGKGEDFADASARQREARKRLFGLAAERVALLAATGTHPWSPWQEQRDHRHRSLSSRARTASSTSRGATTRSASMSTSACAEPTARSRCATGCAPRCFQSCWRSRPTPPSSTGATPDCTRSARQIFTKSFPRCGVPDAFGELLGELRRLRGAAQAHGTRSSSTRNCGGACGRTTRSARSRCGSVTRSPAPMPPRRWPG